MDFENIKYDVFIGLKNIRLSNMDLGKNIEKIILEGPIKNCQKREIEFLETPDKLNLNFCLEKSVIAFGCEIENHLCAQSEQKYRCFEKYKKRLVFSDYLNDREILGNILDSIKSIKSEQKMHIEENRNENCIFIKLSFLSKIITGKNLYFYPIPCNKHKRKYIVDCKILTTIRVRKAFIESKTIETNGVYPDGIHIG